MKPVTLGGWEALIRREHTPRNLHAKRSAKRKKLGQWRAFLKLEQAWRGM